MRISCLYATVSRVALFIPVPLNVEFTQRALFYYTPPWIIIQNTKFKIRHRIKRQKIF